MVSEYESGLLAACMLLIVPGQQTAPGDIMGRFGCGLLQQDNVLIY